MVDPANGRDGKADVEVRDGVVVAIGENLDSRGLDVCDAAGLVVAPGLIDLHVHLRVPGFEHKETMATGTAAAAAGGFTTICCMPNTRPALDSAESITALIELAEREGSVRVHPIAAISVGRAGKLPVDFDALAAAGAIGFSDDGDTTIDSAIMRSALEASKRLNLPVMVHCEDPALARGSMNEGDVSSAIGLLGNPRQAEEIIIARDLLLAQLTGGWLHILHVSTAAGIEMIIAAKRAGIHVTAEVMPHHLLMDETWVAGSRTMLNVREPSGPRSTAAHPDTKVNPPLRTSADTRRLLTALKDGAFDIIATDHAPHAMPEKAETDFVRAASGMSGSEFALPLCLALERAGEITMNEMIRRLSTEPGRLLGHEGGSLSVGAAADIVIFDPVRRWTVTPDVLRSKSANTPLLGMELQGRVQRTLVGGEVRFDG